MALPALLPAAMCRRHAGRTMASGWQDDCLTPRRHIVRRVGASFGERLGISDERHGLVGERCDGVGERY